MSEVEKMIEKRTNESTTKGKRAKRSTLDLLLKKRRKTEEKELYSTFAVHSNAFKLNIVEIEWESKFQKHWIIREERVLNQVERERALNTKH